MSTNSLVTRPARLGLPPAPALTVRQQEVHTLAERYYAVAHEAPTASWLSRRLGISRKRAWEHVQALREKGRWLDRRS